MAVGRLPVSFSLWEKNNCLSRVLGTFTFHMLLRAPWSPYSNTHTHTHTHAALHIDMQSWAIGPHLLLRFSATTCVSGDLGPANILYFSGKVLKTVHVHIEQTH